jgi:hypothetical protein
MSLHRFIPTLRPASQPFPRSSVLTLKLGLALVPEIKFQLAAVSGNGGAKTTNCNPDNRTSIQP